MYKLVKRVHTNILILSHTHTHTVYNQSHRPYESFKSSNSQFGGK